MDKKDMMIKALAEQVAELSERLAEARAELTAYAAQASRLGESQGRYTIDGRPTDIEVSPQKEGA